MTGIQHFHHLDAALRARLFWQPPEKISVYDHPRVLATALGATLYIPADRRDLSTTVARRASEGISSMVLDLEDAVDDVRADAAMDNVVTTLQELGADSLPALLFVRVRSDRCIPEIADRLNGKMHALAGFVIPKFEAATGGRFLRQTEDAATTLSRRLYCMPVLESERVLFQETRDAELAELADLLGAHRTTVLAVRVGATDMCGSLGIRRDRDHTIYDVKAVAEVIAAIVNRFSRTDGTGFVVTAPVWEYFADHERLFRPLLRATPFRDHDAVRFRDMLVSRDLDGLLREISLDRANGLVGKTIIHPTHVAAVNALSVVTSEEFRDATDIAASTTGGVSRSQYRNKMNESRPHRMWARQVLQRARVFGVANDGITFVDFLTALANR
ncbi:HpcH/HpaI aldolase/citrate lyase family protein [Mycolicibacterium sp. 018/SC-01/001]|nr:HpcH/HpaI aldolase/citrate lyase family protein [Mycolicibacterium sp. 018/SC-01/001]